ncbi:MAG: hypothetical protein JRF69_01835 [Deltaproteobacteria bacterium]|nr:hypothetical protein [Deltaproteobacteria bacterium]
MDLFGIKPKESFIAVNGTNQDKGVLQMNRPLRAPSGLICSLLLSVV